jgi:hypothetical protein
MNRYSILKKSMFKERWESLISKKGYKCASECLKDIDVMRLWSETCDVNLINSMPGLTCWMCGQQNSTVKYLHQNTQYVDQILNYVSACPKCFEELEEHWREEWAEYYSMVGA